MPIKLKALIPLSFVFVIVLSGFFWLKTSKISQFKISADAVQSTCGMDVVIVMDMSDSMDNTEQTAMKSALKNLVDNSPSSTFAVVAFGMYSQNLLDFSPSTTSEIVKTRIDGATTKYDDNANWESALYEAKNALAHDFRPSNDNLVIFASDNVPDYHITVTETAPDLIGIELVSDPSGVTALADAKTIADQIKTTGTKIFGLPMFEDVETLDSSDLLLKYQTLIGNLIYNPETKPISETNILDYDFAPSDFSDSSNIHSIGYILNEIADETCTTPPLEYASLGLSVSANPPSHPIGGGRVTFTYIVTNPRDVDVSDISVSDKICSPVVYLNGDANADTKLQSTESWTYSCSRDTTEALISDATVTGLYNGTQVSASYTTTVSIIPAGPPQTGK